MLSKIIVHKVGNRINQESLILSQEELQLEEDMKELLEDFFLKAFDLKKNGGKLLKRSKNGQCSPNKSSG